MLRYGIPRLLLIALLLVTASVPFVAAQEAQQGKPAVADKTTVLALAPVPVQIRTAKRIFIAYTGGESNVSTAGYSGTATRTYDQFYAAMKTWGHYELVPTPLDADLVLEISFDNHVNRVIHGDSHNDPQFKVAFVDVKTHFVLWVLTEHIEPALLQGNRDKNFDQAMVDLVNGISTLAGQPQAITAPRKKDEVREDQRPY